MRFFPGTTPYTTQGAGEWSTMPMLPVYGLHLNIPIHQGLATVGNYSGKPSLTCGTDAGKIFIHSPHEKKAGEKDIKFLNVNKKVTALTAGALDPAMEGRDALMVGTETSLLAYDIDKNQDIFYKDVQDGVSCVVHGEGFDAAGNEVFWTVTGDNVTSLAFCDVDGDGVKELLVGSEDYEIRAFKGQEVVSENTEADTVQELCPTRGTRYAYALQSGTVGVYDKSKRAWKAKSSAKVSALSSFDMTGDDIPEVITGWSNGKLEIRSEASGDVMFKDSISSGVSALLVCDYRLNGSPELMCCSNSGEVRGYKAVDPAAETAGAGDDLGGDDLVIRSLMQRKQELLHELKQYEDRMGATAGGRPDRNGPVPTPGTTESIIPPDTKVNVSLDVNDKKSLVTLTISVTNEVFIRGVIIFAEQLFEGSESCFIHPPDPSHSIQIPLTPNRDVNVDISIKVLAGSRAGSQYHVFELKHKLPKFSMFVPCEIDESNEPQGYVTLRIPERTNRIVLWMNNSFNFEYPETYQHDTLTMGFLSLRDRKPLLIRVTPESGGTITIKTDNIECAGDVVQDLCEFLDVHDMEATADFPTAIEAFAGVLKKVDDLNANRLKLLAEAADSSNMLKSMVIKAEDARMLGDIASMKQAYSTLFNMNQEMLGEYMKRANNQKQLLESLKEVNQMIQRAARLRVGKPKAMVIAACRNAIKVNNISLLFKVIRTGAE